MQAYRTDTLIVLVTDCIYSGRMYPALDQSPGFVRETP